MQLNRLAPDTYPAMYWTESTGYFNLSRLDESGGIHADRTAFCPGLHRPLAEALYRQRNHAAALKRYERYFKAVSYTHLTLPTNREV